MKITGTSLWAPPNTGATNESSFSGVPGGERSGRSDYINRFAYFWSDNAQFITGLKKESGNLSMITKDRIWVDQFISVRCIKD